ncbi:MAG: FHA domain-containing protein [Sandaracinus sp.]|nr:FHA domain-containing protein [Sandaracinus sp.]
MRLLQTFGAHTGRSYDFDQPVVRLGRMPDSDVVFDAHADLDASGRHAEIRREGDAWVLVDVGSRNGTFVAGQRINRHVLRDGDEVECGPGGPRLRVELKSRSAEPVPVRPNAATVAATPVAESSVPRTEPPPALHAPVPAPSTPPPTPSPAPAGTPKLYGQRTVGLMIDEAVARAREAERTTPATPSPPRLLVAAVVSLAGLLGITLLVLLVLVLRDATRDAPDPAHVTAANAAALYRVVVTTPTETTLCTAFAVRRQILATSATCVLALEQRRAEGSTVELRGASSPRIAQLWRHPSHVPGQPGPDVGLIQVDADVPALATLVTPEAVATLGDGSALLAFGYAGAVARTAAIEVDSVETRADGARIFHYEASAPEGAPLFDASGSVVGLHAVTPTSGYGVGVDALLALLAGLPL